MVFDSKILSKDHLRIIITDSGLGGLSVHALLDKLMRKKGIKKKVDLIFYNAVADHDYGYNTISDQAEKIRVFDSALNGMLKFKPDLILIACNTLSVIYKQTEFAKNSSVTVLGIIELGIDAILEDLEIDKKNNLLIFGTKTTIASNQYQNFLLKNGVDKSLIINQACPDLESEIQINPNSEKVKKMVNHFVDEAYKKIDDINLECTSVLACTHYGFSRDIFQKELNKRFNRSTKIINPNEKMAAFVCDNIPEVDSGSPEISNRIVSKVDNSNEEIKSLGSLLMEDSVSVYEALSNYEHLNDLFKI